MGHAIEEWTIAHKKQLVTRETNYQLIVGQLYKLGENGILQCCILEHEKQDIFQEAHEGVTRRYYVGKKIAQKVLHIGI